MALWREHLSSELGVMCGFSLLLFLALLRKGFLWVLGFSPQKPTCPNSNSVWMATGTGLSVLTDC